MPPNLPAPGASSGVWGTLLNQWLGQGGQVYDVVAGYGADPTGVADSTSAIQSALNAVRVAGGGTVYLPAGIYTVNLTPHPLNNTYYSAFVIAGKTHMRGAGRDVTIIRLAANQTRGDDTSGIGDGNCIGLNYDISTGSDQQITISDLTLDGNAANQTHTHGGIALIRAWGAHFERVRVMNCRGTASSGVNETFHFDNLYCTDASYIQCEVIGNAGSTSSGFSANYSSNIKYGNCIVYGMTAGHGFTHYGCANVQHVNCMSYSNGSGAGFNSEQSERVLWLDCIGGSRSSSTSGYPYTASTNLGQGYGFIVNGTSQAQLVGCIASYNIAGANGRGVQVQNSPASAGNRIIGGDFSSNTYGIVVNDAQSATTLRVTNANVQGNGTANLYNVTGGFPAFGNVTAPAVPATTVALTNPFPFDATVYIIPGASTCAVSIGGVATGVTLASNGVGQMFRLPAGQSITLAYTSAPTWAWFLE